jgi:hypothetical protein
LHNIQEVLGLNIVRFKLLLKQKFDNNSDSLIENVCAYKSNLLSFCKSDGTETIAGGIILTDQKMKKNTKNDIHNTDSKKKFIFSFAPQNYLNSGSMKIFNLKNHFMGNNFPR